MTIGNLWKRVIAGTLAMLVVAGAVPANSYQGGIMRDTALVASAETVTTVTTFDQLNAAVAWDGVGGSIKLGTDITVPTYSDLYITCAAADLDLNGHTLTLGEETIYACGISDPTGDSSPTSFTIRDSSSEGSGKVTYSGDAFIVLTSNNSSFTLESGTLETTNSQNSGIDVWEGSFTMNGGTISSANYSIWRDGGAVTINGGKIIGGFRGESGDLSITGGTFSFDPTDLLADGYYVTDNQDDTYTVNYTPPKVNVTSVGLSCEEFTLKLEDILALEASVEPSNASDMTVTWSSSDPDVATVDDQGNVTAVGLGNATITATATNGTEETDDDKTAECTITVKKNIELPIYDGMSKELLTPFKYSLYRKQEDLSFDFIYSRDDDNGILRAELNSGEYSAMIFSYGYVTKSVSISVDTDGTVSFDDDQPRLHKIGDYNGDGKINFRDILTAVQVANGNKQEKNDYLYIVLDVQEGKELKVDYRDVMKLIQAANGKIDLWNQQA